MPITSSSVELPELDSQRGEDTILAEIRDQLTAMEPMFTKQYEEGGYDYTTMYAMYSSIASLLDEKVATIESIDSLLEIRELVLKFNEFFQAYGTYFTIDVALELNKDLVGKIKREICMKRVRSIPNSILDPKALYPTDEERIKGMENVLRNMFQDMDIDIMAAKAALDHTIKHLAFPLFKKIARNLKKLLGGFESTEYVLGGSYSRIVITYFGRRYRGWQKALGLDKGQLGQELEAEIEKFYLAYPSYREANVLDAYRPIESVVKVVESKPVKVEQRCNSVNISINGHILKFELDNKNQIKSTLGSLNLRPEIIARLGKSCKDIIDIIAVLRDINGKNIQDAVTSLRNPRITEYPKVSGIGIIYTLVDAQQKPLCRINFEIGQEALKEGNKIITIKFYELHDGAEIPVTINGEP